MRKIILACLLLLPAAYAGAVTLGEAANNVNDNVFAVVLTLIINACYFVGGGFLLFSIKQYKDHRDNPQLVSFGKVMTYFIIGLALVLLPFTVDYIKSRDGITGDGSYRSGPEAVEINY